MKNQIAAVWTYRSPLLAAVLACLFLALNSNAQTRPQLSGTVTDEQHATVADAHVTLLSRTGFQVFTKTDQNGQYRFANVHPGRYLIQISRDGFSNFVSDEITIGDRENRLDAVLKVAAINASVVVTATGTLQRAEEVAKVVSTLDSEQIEQRHDLSIAESLRGVPGLRVQQQGSPGALTTLRLRGQRNSDTALLLDGLRVRDASEINGSAVSLIADLVPVALDRIEIMRGSGSSIYGSHAIGGVVNLISERGMPGFHLGAGFEAGGLATFRERLQISGGKNRVAFNLDTSRTDVRRGVDQQDQYGDTAFGGRVQFDLSNESNIVARLYGTSANARINDSPFALPAAFSSANPKAVAGITFQPDFNNPDQGRRNRLLVGSIRFTQSLNDAVSFSVAYQRVASNRRNYNGPLVDPRFAAFVPFGDFEFLNVNRGTTDTLDGRFNIRFSKSNVATMGTELESEALFQHSDPSFSTFNDTTNRQRTFAIFAQDQLSFLDDRLQLSLGIRGQSYRVRSADRPGTLQGASTDGSVTGDGAVAYLFRSTNTKLRAHAGNGFRAPSLFERFGEGTFGAAGVVRFGDPTLKAEQSISFDGGLDQRLAGERVVLGATYFYTRLQRVIAFTGFAMDPLGLGRFSGYVNRPGGLSRGVETSVDAKVTRRLDLNAAYTFTNSDRFEPAAGLRPEYVIPKHLFSLSVNQRLRSWLINFHLNQTGSYLAPVFENNFPFRMAELKFDGYTKGDLFISYETHRYERLTLVLFGGFENIFDQRYYENGFLAPGAVGRGGIKVKF